MRNDAHPEAATYRRIRQAIAAALTRGESTALQCSTELSGDAARAYAEESLLREHGGSVTLTLDGSILVVRPIELEEHIAA
jgi:hypothetical protein